MAKKTIRLPVTVVVADPKNSSYGYQRDGKNNILQDANGKDLPPVPVNVHPLHIEAGQPVELEAEEADRLVAIYGTYDPATAPVIPGTPSPVKVHSARG